VRELVLISLLAAFCGGLAFAHDRVGFQQVVEELHIELVSSTIITVFDISTFWKAQSERGGVRATTLFLKASLTTMLLTSLSRCHFHGPPLWRPDLSPKRRGRDWHARFAD
jgi:uncharacterized membrane protein